MLTITTLIENEIASFANHRSFSFDNNSPPPRLCAEHGLSLHIQHNEKNYLIDTGASGAFIQNADVLGIDLQRLDAIIISHGHADHIGGLSALLAMNHTAKVYLRHAAAHAHYSDHSTGSDLKSIGADPALFEAYADRFVFFEDEIDVADGFILLSNKIDDARYACKDKGLFMEHNGTIVPDDFRHECFAVFEEAAGLVLVSSCSHAGIVNIVRTVQTRYPGKPILRIVGGFHLMGFGAEPMNCTADYAEEIADILDHACIGGIHTCHCTGHVAFEIMQRQIGDKITFLQTGSILAQSI